MKKHKNILVILLLAVGFVGILIWNDQAGVGIGGGTPPPQGTEVLQNRLDALGKNTWDQKSYKSLKVDIGSNQMAGVITEDGMSILLATLEDKASAAMVLSFDQWLSEECGSNWPKINSLIALIKKQVPSPEIKKRIQIYSNFKIFLGNQSSVSSFLKREYTAAEASSLEARINGSLSQEGVSSCSAMQYIKNEWFAEIQYFKKNIHDVFLELKDDQGSCADETCSNFQPYTFYHNQLLKLAKC